VKNTLALRAFGEAQVSGLDAHLAGPTALVLAGADPWPRRRSCRTSQGAREARDQVGLVTASVTPEQVKRLALLPSKPELLAQLGGALQAPLAGFVGALNGLLVMWVGALEALKTKRARAPLLKESTHGDADDEQGRYPRSHRNMSVTDLAELIEAFKEKFGVTITARRGSARAGAAAAAPAAEEKTEFTVVLKDGGEKKIQVIKEVRS